jgi:hypothetical protein
VNSMCTPSVSVARGHVLHDAGRAPALGVDQEVRAPHRQQTLGRRERANRKWVRALDLISAGVVVVGVE